MYDVVVTHGRSPRDGVFIEKIGIYNPLTNPATIDIRPERALDWLMKGAQPSETVKAMLSYKGILLKKHLQVGVLKGAITQEEADKRFETWKSAKDSKINAKIERLTGDKEKSKKDRLSAESKIKETRAAAIKQKQVVLEKAEETETIAPVAEARDTSDAAAVAPAETAPEPADTLPAPAPATETEPAQAGETSPAAEASQKPE
jgi:small subunit ribosomal protein S16